MKVKLPDYYDDPQYNYQQYWKNRQYENESEKIALNRLLDLIPQKGTIADLGAGFGRLAPAYAPKFDQCFLLDPSQKMLRQAKSYCQRLNNISLARGCLENIPLASASIDTALIVRTVHHCPNLSRSFTEISRILKQGGYLILEFPNTVHIKNTLKHILHGQPIKHFTKRKNLASGNNVPFFNYHPKYVAKLLRDNQLAILKTLSVSNLRGSIFKKIIGSKNLLTIEKITQPLLAKIYFGPSIFILAQKQKQPSKT